MKKRICALVMSTMMLTSLLAGCGNANEPSPDTTQDTSENSSETVTKDSLTIGIGADFQMIVPQSRDKAILNRDAAAVYSLFDPLIWRDSETGELQPCIATSWDASADGLEYTLKLRDDVQFHDGTKMTAEDVVWTLNLMPTCPSVSTQNYPTFDKAEAVDDTTVKIYLSKPFAPFINVLASYHIVVLSKAYYDKVGGFEAYAEDPVGTGPYKFVSREIGTNLKLEAFDNYWGTKAVIKNLTFNVIPDANAQIIALEAGEIDTLLYSSISNIVKIDTNKGVKWESCQASLTNILNFNGASTIMEDENLRKAILSGINYDGINKAINSGYTEKAETIAIPGTAARPENGTFEPVLKYNVEDAKKYLTASNYAEGTPVRLVCMSGSKEESVAKVIQGDLQSLGINIQVMGVDSASFATSITNGDYDVLLMSVMPSLFDMNLLFQMFDPAQPLIASGKNKFPDIQKLGELGIIAREEMDPDKRVGYYKEMMDIINSHAYMGFVFHDVNVIAYRDSLKNAKPLPGGNYRFNTWTW